MTGHERSRVNCTTSFSIGFEYPQILVSARGLGGFPGGSDGKESACDAGNPDSIPGLGRSPGEGNGYPPQYSCLENSMDRGAWRAIAHVVNMTEQLTHGVLEPIP